MITEYIEKMPKIELHCHLDGSVPIETLYQLAKDSQLSIPNNIKDFSKLVTAPQDCESLVEYLQRFDIPIGALQTAENLSTAAYSLVKECSKENVVYLEVRFAPLFHLQKGLTLNQVVEGVLQGLEKGRQDFGVEYGLILCGMRHQPVEENTVLLQLAEDYKNKGVVAVDLAGDEKGFPVGGQADFFIKAKELGIPYTIHAGEADGAESIWNALKLGTKRIGHGIAMKDDPKLLKYCVEEGIGIEMCPISNLQTKAISSWEDYPYNFFYNAGAKVTINTDNRTVSQTNLTKELTTLNQYFGLTKEQLNQLYLNAVEVSFANREIKNKLKESLSSF